MEIEKTINKLMDAKTNNDKILEHVKSWITENIDQKTINVKTINKSQLRDITNYPCFYASTTFLAALIVKFEISKNVSTIPLFVLAWVLLLLFLRKTIPQFIPSIRKKFILAAPHASIHRVIRRSLEEGGIIIFYSPTTVVPLGRKKQFLKKTGQLFAYLSVLTLIAVGITYEIKKMIKPNISLFHSTSTISIIAIALLFLTILFSTVSLILTIIANSANILSKPDPINNATGITVNLELLKKNAKTAQIYKEVPIALHIFGPIDQPHGKSIMKILHSLDVTPELMDITIIRLQLIGRGNFVPILTDQDYPSLIPTLISFALQTSGSLDGERTHLIFPVETKDKIEDPSPWKIKKTEHALISTQSPVTWNWTQLTNKQYVSKSPRFVIPPYDENQPYRLELLIAIIEFFDELLKEIMGISTDQLERAEINVINEITQLAKIIIEMQNKLREQMKSAEKTALAIINTFSENLEYSKQNEEILLTEDSLEAKLIAGLIIMKNNPELFEKIVLELSKNPGKLRWKEYKYPSFIRKTIEETGILEQISPKFTELHYLFDEINPLNPIAITDYLISELMYLYSKDKAIQCGNFCKELLFLNKRPIIQKICWEIIEQTQPPQTLGYLLQTVFNLLEDTQYPRPVIRTIAKIAAKGSLKTFILTAQKILEKPMLTQNHLPIIEELGNQIQSQYREQILTILKAYLSIGTCSESRNLATKILLTEKPELLKTYVEEN